MKLLKIEEPSGYFLGADGNYILIDKITKDDLLRMVNFVLSKDAAELDKLDESKLKNQAHQVIYKSISQKLIDLRSRRKEFVDSSARLFLAEYEKYRDS